MINDPDLRAFVLDWMASDKARSTAEGYAVCLRKYQRWADEQRLDSATMRTARAYLRELSQQTKWQTFMTGRAMKAYSKWWAVECSAADPFAELAFVPQPKQRPQRTATDIEIAELLLSIPGDNWRGLRDRALILVAASSGLRRGELARMTWTDIDTYTGWLQVPSTKNGHPRVSRIDQPALRALRRYDIALRAWELNAHRLPLGDAVWVGYRRDPLTTSGINQIFRDRGRAIGSDLTPHSLRRAMAVRWLARGGSETLLREVGGWRSPRMIQVYISAVAQSEALRQHEELFG